MKPWRLRRWLLLAASIACLAPTPGDIGGCGQPPALLDAGKFFQKKREVDCAACQTCAIVNQRCLTLCSDPVPEAFPRGCFPLVHDGEVCLRALSHSSCDEYASYLDDTRPSIPTECNFCPERPGPSSPDGGDR